MLTNKVSPASLLSCSEPSATAENGTDTCNSQLLLFDAPSSIELFSDTAHSQSASQSLGDKFFQQPTAQQPRAKAPVAKIISRQQPEIPLRRMFFDKYLKKSKSVGPQKIVQRSEISQVSRMSQDSTYEEWKSSQKFTSEIEKAVKEGMKEAKDEIKNEFQELRAVIMEHKSGIAKTEKLSTQLLASVAELRECVEQCSKEKQSSISSCLESQSTMLSKKLDGLLENLTGRIRHLETLINCSNHTTATTDRNTATTCPEPVEQGKTPPVMNVIDNDRTVPALKDSLLNSHQNDTPSYHQDDMITKPRSILTQSASTQKCPLTDNSQNEFSTSCDIDLTKESSSVYCQMIANIMKVRQKENTPHVKTEKDTVTQRKKGHKAKLSQKTVYSTPLATRRRSQRKRIVKSQYKEIESSEGEYSFQPKRRAVQPKPKQYETTPQKAVTTPSTEMDSFNIFFSQTPNVPTVSGGSVTQPEIAQKQFQESNIFHRSTEAARRRVEVFAGLSSSTSALLDISNVIKKQQEGYSSDDSL